jgi:CDP-4-dehydro-6-deoxyglucose reductase
MLSPSVRSLVFEVMGSAAFEHEPGHYVDLFVPPPRGLVMRRSYSIASAPAPERPTRVELAVTRVEGGVTSSALHAIPPGTVLEADGPRGSFLRWPSMRDDPTLFVAAGTGLAPLRAMLQAELARAYGPPVALLFGCRTEADLLWADELHGWRAHHPRFRLAVTLSRPPPSPGAAPWSGRVGHVQRHVDELVRALAPTRAFVCGLSAMVDAASDALERAGVPRASIHAEAYDGRS